MTATRPHPSRPRRTIGVLAATGLAVMALSAGAAHADDQAGTAVGVTVPRAVTTTPPPTTPPPTPPPPPSSPTTRAPVPNTNRPPAARDEETPDAQETQGLPATEPRLRDEPAADGAPAQVDEERYGPGATVTVTADGFDPGEQVQVVLYSTPHLIGNVAAGADGTFSHRFALPDDLASGRHTVQLTGWQSGHVATAELLITSAPLAVTGQGVSGVPTWVWWAGGTLLAALLAYGVWRVLRVMRAPGSQVPEVPEAAVA